MLLSLQGLDPTFKRRNNLLNPAGCGDRCCLCLNTVGNSRWRDLAFKLHQQPNCIINALLTNGIYRSAIPKTFTSETDTTSA